MDCILGKNKARRNKMIIEKKAQYASETSKSLLHLSLNYIRLNWSDLQQSLLLVMNGKVGTCQKLFSTYHWCAENVHVVKDGIKNKFWSKQAMECGHYKWHFTHAC